MLRIDFDLSRSLPELVIATAVASPDEEVRNSALSSIAASSVSIDTPANMRSDCPFNFYRVSKTLCGLARPSYKKTSSWNTVKDVPQSKSDWGPVDRNIYRDLNFIHSEEVKQIISFSNKFYHQHMDGRIQRIWGEFEGVFHHIPTEDHVTEEGEDDKRVVKGGEGITAEKLLHFHRLIKESGLSTAVYCGAGQGRTGAYLLALSIADKIESVSPSFSIEIDHLIDETMTEIGTLFAQQAEEDSAEPVFGAWFLEEEDEWGGVVEKKPLIQVWSEDVEKSGVRREIPRFLEMLTSKK